VMMLLSENKYDDDAVIAPLNTRRSQLPGGSCTCMERARCLRWLEQRRFAGMLRRLCLRPTFDTDNVV